MNQYIIKNTPRITAIHSLFTYTYPADYKFHGESHNFYEVIIILSGSATVAADSNVFTLKSGQAFIHTPMQFHNVYSTGKEKLSVAVFSFSAKNMPKLHNKICVVNNLTAVYELFNKANDSFIFNDIWVTGSKNDTVPYALIKEFELLILELNSNILEKHNTNSTGEKNYGLIVKTLEEHICEPLMVKDVAFLCNMSEIGLQKTFSRFAGVGVMEYFNNIKIRKAIEHLKEGFSVKETAIALGFSDPNYFSTVFKRITGNPPSFYKK